MRALLIDPYNKEIREVVHDGTLKSIYALLDCQMIEAPVHYNNNDIIYCNEEAWLRSGADTILAGFMFPGWSYAILERGLIVGTDDEGNDVDCKSVINDFKDIIWMDHYEMKNQGVLMDLL